MNESEIPDDFVVEKRNESPNDSLAKLPPTPVTSDGSTGIALGSMFLAAAGTAAILLISGSPGRCRGATQSVKLQWEERQLQMEQAEREFTAGSQSILRADTDSSDAE